jgi:predicted Zn-dependent protease
MELETDMAPAKSTPRHRHARAAVLAFSLALLAASSAACGGRETTTETKSVRAQDIVIHNPEIPEGAVTHGKDDGTLGDPSRLRASMERKRAGVGPPPKLEDFSVDDEQLIGESTARAILGRYPLVPVDSQICQYVRTVGAILAESSTRRDITFYFAIVEAPGPNAFAAPYGYIFITTGLLDLVQNEAELAFVLGHEIAHVELRHGLEQITAGWYEQDKRSFDAISEQLSLEDGVGRSEGEKELAEWSHRLSDLVIQAKGRPQETDADRRGVELLASVGYNPAAATTFIERMMGKLGARSGEVDLFRSHPHLEERLAAARSAIRVHGTSGELLAERFRSFVPAR